MVGAVNVLNRKRPTFATVCTDSILMVVLNAPIIFARAKYEIGRKCDI